jgi:hypothetical protein
VNATRIFQLSLPGFAAMALLACNARTTDSVVRLKQVFAERPVVADADNAFLDVYGFLSPADADAHEVGARRAKAKSASADPKKPAFDTKEQRSQALSQVVDACRAAIARACASALERVKGEAPLSGIEQLLLARYEVLLGRRGWSEIGVTDPMAPRVTYEGAIEAQRLFLIRLRNVAAAGDAAKVRAALGRDIAFWRMVLSSSNMLVSKMIALAAIRQHFTFGSFVLRDLPPERATEAIPAQWREEFTLQERSMLRALAGEIMFAEKVMQAGEGRMLVSPDPEPGGVFDKLAHRKNREPKLDEIADAYLSAAQAFQAPLHEYEAVAAKVHAEYARSRAGWDVSQYAERVGSAEGMRRAALLTVELRSQSVPVAGLPERLNSSPLRNPYNGQPFTWDAADQAIVFIGPEQRDNKRQAYLY